MSDDTVETTTSKEKNTFEASAAASAANDSSKEQQIDGDPKDISVEKIDDVSETGYDSDDSETVCKNWQKIRRNREIVYQIIRAVHQASRYLGTYFRSDDILSVANLGTTKLEVSVFFIEIQKIYNDIKLILMSKQLPATDVYAPHLDQIFNNLRAIRVNVDTDSLTVNSLLLSDYNLVISGSLPLKCDNAVDEIPDNCPPPLDSIMNLELERPFCTAGYYLSMTSSEFTDSPCYSMHKDHGNRFKATATIQNTPLSTRNNNDSIWLVGRNDYDSINKFMHPQPLQINSIPGLLSSSDITAIWASTKAKHADPNAYVENNTYSAARKSVSTSSDPSSNIRKSLYPPTPRASMSGLGTYLPPPRP
jgi:hypothetical protein